MSLRIALTHRIECRFERPVRLSTHWLRLRPAPHVPAAVEAYSLRIEPSGHFINWLRDPYENHLARLDLPEPVPQLAMTVELLLALTPVNPFDFTVEPFAAQAPFEYPPQLRKELAPYLAPGAGGPRLAAWFGRMERKPGYIVEFLNTVNSAVHERVALDPQARTGAIDVEALLARGRGTAWELAWLLTLSVRDTGLAARFVSGYRVFAATAAPATASARLHAWSEVFVPGAGWIGLDPSAALFTDEHYVALAAAPDPLRALPWVGYREACVERQQETVTARVLAPAPDAWPYADSVWGDIDALGRRVEHDLRAAGVALTVARSLSFVATDDAAAPEWNSAALGSAKREQAHALLAALRARLAPGGMLHLGQGEWYAGEALPRWRLSCCYRADGTPVWREPARLAMLQARPGSPPDARAFGECVARALGLPPSALMPAYEDGLQRRWQAGGVPPPAPEDLRDPLRRRALADRLSEAAGAPVGYVLPLRRDAARGCWTSGSWNLRRARLYLAAGDSPLGYRLPLDSLPAQEEGETPFAERCPFEPRAPLPELHGEVSARLTHFEAPAATPHAADEAAASGAAPRTALCVEVRDGALHVFLPPITHLEHYLELIAAIEAAAESLQQAVWLEGYAPPTDPRLRRLTLEPDAGVLRLQLPETAGWNRQVALLEAAYEEAARLGLAPRRVLADGTEQPTGGGSAVILGGTSAIDSPFLQRPHLLRSLIACWQRHPSLSYFFATRAVGPSGTAPRPDEGRAEALYELGIALERIVPDAELPPWFPDRILRHLLADPAGDMRRAEWRVDALYDPARASRRLGQVTLRAFETPLHARLAAVQSLLIMALVAHFARKPDSGALVPWGAALHDRFLLPQPLWQDLDAVLRALAAADMPLQREWFAPFLDWHFPPLGTAPIGGIALELRVAHEPLPVLAEEVTGAGVVRFVDTANERVQVRLTGLAPGRYVLVCNGRRVPLQPGGAHDEFVGGVRFKASNPHATLHPTTPAFTALVFDLVDTWTGRVVGGCTYVIPPRHAPLGPTAFAGAPHEEGEGAGRRPQAHPTAPWFVPQRGLPGRFLPHGPRGRMMPPPPEPGAGYVLDLTRAS